MTHARLNRWNVAFVVAILASLAGSGKPVKLTDQDRPKTDPKEIAIVLGTPKRPYEAIALLEVKAPEADDLPKVVEELKKQAGKLGAHAIMELDTEVMPYSMGDYSMTGTRATAVAIVWSNGACQ